VSSTDRFIALLAGLAAILAVLGGALRYLARISYQMGQLTQRFGDHVSDASKIHEDQERRLREVEQRRRR